MIRDLSLLAGLACVLVLPVSAENIHIEADTYSTSGEIPSCGYGISRVSCDGATEGIAVGGVDCDGEWIAISLTLPAEFCFHVGLQSARYEGLISRFQIEFRTDDAHQTLAGSDTLVTSPGHGAG